MRRDHITVRRIGITAGAAAAGAFALAPTAHAATIEVDTLNDAASDATCTPAPADCTLRDALDISDSNAEADDITFLSTLTGTIRLQAGELLIDDPAYPYFTTNIRGPGRDQLEVSADSDDNGTGNSRLLNLGGPEDLTISGLTLTEGNAAGDIGGAMRFDYGAEVALTNAAVTNSDANSGAGIFSGGELSLTNTIVSGNEAVYEGGGINSFGGLVVRNSRITDNTTTNAGSGGGAGIFQDETKYGVEITNSTVSGNSTATRGGGINWNGDAKYGVKLNLTDSTVSGNSAALAGAGMFIGDFSGGERLRVERSTISGNNGGPNSYGGGIGFDFRVNGRVNVVNSTVSGNNARVGGGVSLGTNYENPLLGPAGEVVFNNSTIARNTADNRGGGVYLGQYLTTGTTKSSATVPFNSTIVADNSVGGSRQDLDQGNAAVGGGLDLAFSLIERRGDARIIQSPPGSNIIGVDPKLGALRNNGGPTQTHKPAGSSRVVDHGDSSRLATDQRGRARRVNFGVPDTPTGNGTDIGSVELRRGEVPNAKCAGKLATIIGGSKKIVGTNGPDIISGTAGKNVIRGRGGRDVICGGKGRDRLIGGGGRDRLIGGPGRDRLRQ